MVRIFIVSLLLLFVSCTPSFYVQSDNLSYRESFYTDNVTIKPFTFINDFVDIKDGLASFPDRPIDIALKDSLTFPEMLNNVFTESNTNIVVRVDEALEKVKIAVPKYSGSLVSLLGTLQDQHGLFMTFDKGILSVMEHKTFVVAVPRFDSANSEIESTLNKLGATGVTYDADNSILVFSCNYNSYKHIRDYIQRVIENSSVINLHLIVLSLAKNKDVTTGFDWSSFQSSYGVAQATSYSLKQSGAGFLFQGASGRFSVQSLVGFLAIYGKVNILQDVFLSVGNTYKGKIDSSNHIPYVDAISVSYPNNATASQPIQSYSFKEVEQGVIFNVDVLNDGRNKTVTLDLDGRVQDVLSFMTIQTSAGPIQRPVVQVRNITTTVSMGYDETVVIGGQKASSVNNSFTGLPGSYIGQFEDKTSESQVLIIIHPEVRITKKM